MSNYLYKKNAAFDVVQRANADSRYRTAIAMSPINHAHSEHSGAVLPGFASEVDGVGGDEQVSVVPVNAPRMGCHMVVAIRCLMTAINSVYLASDPPLSALCGQDQWLWCAKNGPSH